MRVVAQRLALAVHVYGQRRESAAQVVAAQDQRTDLRILAFVPREAGGGGVEVREQRRALRARVVAGERVGPLVGCEAGVGLRGGRGGVGGEGVQKGEGLREENVAVERAVGEGEDVVGEGGEDEVLGRAPVAVGVRKVRFSAQDEVVGGGGRGHAINGDKFVLWLLILDSICIEDFILEIK